MRCVGHDAGRPPWTKNSQLENVHFICCLKETSTVEMATFIVEDLLKLEVQIIAYNVYLKQAVAPVPCILGDNPHVSELLNYQRSTAK